MVHLSFYCGNFWRHPNIQNKGHRLVAIISAVGITKLWDPVMRYKNLDGMPILMLGNAYSDAWGLYSSIFIKLFCKTSLIIMWQPFNGAFAAGLCSLVQHGRLCWKNLFSFFFFLSFLDSVRFSILSVW